jgi:His-Xaa-Ser system protein HxsD
MHLAPYASDEIAIEFRGRSETASLSVIVGEFLNELIDQRVRADIDRETRRIREMIVAQAFAEADIDQEALRAQAPPSIADTGRGKVG